jgi:hypothetical protein
VKNDICQQLNAHGVYGVTQAEVQATMQSEPEHSSFDSEIDTEKLIR